jgi:hypothetical protein
LRTTVFAQRTLAGDLGLASGCTRSVAVSACGVLVGNRH